jgi:hypothetical protein
MRPAATLLVLLVVSAGVGCVVRTDLMDYRAPHGLDVGNPPADKSLVILLRPGRIAGAVSASVFDEQALVAVLMDETYVAYETTPGEHRFMVVGEAADFMGADLEGGKVYFARVASRMGVWRARFSLLPVTSHDDEWRDLRGWLADSRHVTLNAEGRAWAEQNAPSVREKHDDYLRKWLAKEVGERPVLRREDGMRLEDLPRE